MGARVRLGIEARPEGERPVEGQPQQADAYPLGGVLCAHRWLPFVRVWPFSLFVGHSFRVVHVAAWGVGERTFVGPRSSIVAYAISPALPVDISPIRSLLMPS